MIAEDETKVNVILADKYKFKTKNFIIPILIFSTFSTVTSW